MEKIRVFCPAKINLSLNVGKKREDGYHYIDSIMQSVDLGDYMTVMPRLDNKINLKFLNADIDLLNNSVMKAVDLIRKQFGDFGADIIVEKHIPLSGGLGGSSANAAGIIFALDKLFSLSKRGLDVFATARKVGSDVPFMLNGGCALVTGTGEKLQSIKNNLPLNIVIAKKSNAGCECTSKAVYGIFDELAADGMICDNALLSSLLNAGDAKACSLFSNALAPASKSLCGSINETFEAFENALCVNMSGSGDCVYGCFADYQTAKNAAEKMKSNGLWAHACRSVDYGIKTV